MKRITSGLAVAVLAISCSTAMAQDSLVEHLIEACQDDLDNYCSQVTPGEGRLLHCMAAHSDKISGRCEYAFYQAASLLEQMAAAVSYLATACETDIQTHCGDVVVGDGRILACLSDHEEDVSDSCRDAIDDTVSE